MTFIDAIEQTATILERLRQRLHQAPNDNLFTFVDADGEDRKSLTCQQLFQASEQIGAALLHQVNLKPGDRVLLVYPPGLEFVKSFVGCLLSGVIPVPIAPPNPFKLEHDLSMFEAIAKNSGSSVVLTESFYLDKKHQMENAFLVRQDSSTPPSRWITLPWYATDRLDRGEPLSYLDQPTQDSLAYLQYTSGSTSMPKGVMISHGNIMHQLQVTAQTLGFTPESRLVAWVPHFHDFCLVSGILNTLCGNGSLYLLSPLSFVQRPAVWFEVMSRVKATHTAAPDFAYLQSVRKTTPEQRQQWDLSTLQVIMSAAEPIRATTVDAFLDAFAESGLNRSAFCPAYGLAEHTVGVSVRGRQRIAVERDPLEWERVVKPAEVAESSRTLTLVGCGSPFAGVDVRIVDPETCIEQPEGQVGEIWVNSPSKALGYWGLSELYREVFEARISDNVEAGRYLRTGDLGFLLEGELYVAGRLKDTIIIRGRNLYPQDLEETVCRCHPSILPGGAVVFSAADPVINPNSRGEEQIAVIAEIGARKPSAEQLNEIIRSIRSQLLRDHQVSCRTIAIAPPGTILKTTSGKVRRQASRQAYLKGTLQGSVFKVDTIGYQSDKSSEKIAEHDLRLQGMTADFHKLISNLALLTGERGKNLGRRSTHTVAVAGFGQIEFLHQPNLPEHPFFEPGKKFPVIVRHAAGKGFEDDAIMDVRSATMRIVDGPADTSWEELNLHKTLLDIIMNSGHNFPWPHAASFFRWFNSSMPERLKMTEEYPSIVPNFQYIARDPESYTKLYFFNKMTVWFVGKDGKRRFMRYRLRNANLCPDSGFINPLDMPPPMDHVPRKENDTRPRTYLRDDFRQRVENGGVDYLLEIHLREVEESEDLNEAAKETTIGWDEELYPYYPIARLSLRQILPNEQVEPLEFNVWNAPDSLGIIWAKSPYEGASINHARTLVYEIVQSMRKTGQPTAALMALESIPKIEEVSLKEALEKAAETIQDLAKRRNFFDAQETLALHVTETVLSKYPAALRYVLKQFFALEGQLNQVMVEPLPASEDLHTCIAEYGHLGTIANPDDVEAITQLHRRICLRTEDRRQRVSSLIFTNRKQLKRYWLGGAYLNSAVDYYVGPAQILPVSEERTVSISRAADIRLQDKMVVLTEFTTCWTKENRQANQWRLISAIGTLHQQVPVETLTQARDVVKQFFDQEIASHELRFKAEVALLGAILIDAFEHFVSVDGGGHSPDEPVQIQSPRHVCVIGAGVSGLTTAYELQRLGHKVTVLEREGSIAGKCSSAEIDGYWYDLGGHVYTEDYHATKQLLDEIGVERERTTPYFTYDLQHQQVVADDAALYEKQNFLKYHVMKWSEFPGIARPGLVYVGDALSESVAEWLHKHQLPAMAQSLGIGHTAAGYGYLSDDSIPVIHFVKYSDTAGFMSLNPEVKNRQQMTVKGGWLNVWNKVANSLSDLRCNVHIQQIERQEKGVRVITGNEELLFDEVVLALPFERSLKFLDASPQEQNLFSKIRYIDYYTTVCTIEGIPRNAFYFLKEHNLDPAHVGHIVSFHHRYEETNVYTIYSYGNESITGEDIVRYIEDDVQRMGGKLVQVHLQRSWKYMPHASIEDLKQGYYQQFEAMQGEHHTYYAGSLLNFELIEGNVAYAKELVRRFFKPTRSDIQVREAYAAATAVVGVSEERYAGELTFKKVQDWIVNHLAADLEVPVTEIDPQAPLESYPLDSLLTVGLIGELTSWLGWRIEPYVFLELPTVEAVANYIVERDAKQSQAITSNLDPLLVEFRKGQLRRDKSNHVPLFCVHPIGGSTAKYIELFRQLGKEYSLYGIQAEGIEEGRPIDTIPKMAARYIQAIKKRQPEGLYILSGWSFGGLVAFEIAQQLLANHDSVAFIALLDTPAPLSESAKQLHQSPAEQDAFLRDWFNRDVLASHLTLLPEEMERLFQVFKANWLAMQSYTPTEKCTCPVFQFQAAEQTWIQDFLERMQIDANWQPYIQDTIRAEVIVGVDHYSIVNSEALATKLRQLIEQSQGEVVK